MSHDTLNYGAVVIKIRINLYVLISFEKKNRGLAIGKLLHNERA